MTINLLLNSEGKKMGKTQSGAVWLDPNKTTPFDFSSVLEKCFRRGRIKMPAYAYFPASGADR